MYNLVEEQKKRKKKKEEEEAKVGVLEIVIADLSLEKRHQRQRDFLPPSS